ncbi:MAG: hypothetical protein LC768_07350 [Acidobacteria bacterium]|nr:hypothetical protein [Acidobacteriota bacterium]
MVKAVNTTEDFIKKNRVNVVGLCANVCNHESAIRQIAEIIKRGNGGYVCFSTVHMVMESYDNPEYGAKVLRR